MIIDDLWIYDTQKDIALPLVSSKHKIVSIEAQ